MTPEIWTIIGVGIALATVIMASNRRLERGFDARMDRVDERMDRLDDRMDRLDGRMDRLEARIDRLDGRIDQLNGRMERDKVELLARLDGVENQIGALRERMAHSDGLLEGLREAIVHNRAA